jgi:ATP-binding cassette, subfamily C (CFTR/MRP), member 1
MVFYLPSLDPYHTSIRNEVLVDNTDYEPPPGGEQIRPKRHANILSS